MPRLGGDITVTYNVTQKQAQIENIGYKSLPDSAIDNLVVGKTDVEPLMNNVTTLPTSSEETKIGKIPASEESSSPKENVIPRECDLVEAVIDNCLSTGKTLSEPQADNITHNSEPSSMGLDLNKDTTDKLCISNELMATNAEGNALSLPISNAIDAGENGSVQPEKIDIVPTENDSAPPVAVSINEKSDNVKPQEDDITGQGTDSPEATGADTTSRSNDDSSPIKKSNTLPREPCLSLPNPDSIAIGNGHSELPKTDADSAVENGSPEPNANDIIANRNCPPETRSSSVANANEENLCSELATSPSSPEDKSSSKELDSADNLPENKNYDDKDAVFNTVALSEVEVSSPNLNPSKAITDDNQNAMERDTTEVKNVDEDTTVPQNGECQKIHANELPEPSQDTISNKQEVNCTGTPEGSQNLANPLLLSVPQENLTESIKETNKTISSDETANNDLDLKGFGENQIQEPTSEIAVKQDTSSVLPTVIVSQENDLKPLSAEDSNSETQEKFATAPISNSNSATNSHATTSHQPSNLRITVTGIAIAYTRLKLKLLKMQLKSATKNRAHAEESINETESESAKTSAPPKDNGNEEAGEHATPTAISDLTTNENGNETVVKTRDKRQNDMQESHQRYSIEYPDDGHV